MSGWGRREGEACALSENYYTVVCLLKSRGIVDMLCAQLHEGAMDSCSEFCRVD